MKTFLRTQFEKFLQWIVRHWAKMEEREAREKGWGNEP